MLMAGRLILRWVKKAKNNVRLRNLKLLEENMPSSFTGRKSLKLETPKRKTSKSALKLFNQNSKRISEYDNLFPQIISRNSKPSPKVKSKKSSIHSMNSKETEKGNLKDQKKRDSQHNDESHKRVQDFFDQEENKIPHDPIIPTKSQRVSLTVQKQYGYKVAPLAPRGKRPSVKQRDSNSQMNSHWLKMLDESLETEKGNQMIKIAKDDKPLLL